MKKEKAIIALTAVIMMILSLTGCGEKTINDDSQNNGSQLKVTSSMDVEYAEGFDIDYYEDGYTGIRISDGQQFLIVPEGADVPEISGMTILKQPLDKTYLAATAAMSLVAAIGAVDDIAFSSVEKDGWYVKDAVDAMDKGDMVFAGKYSLPDYELLVSGGCKLAVESTMLTHSPEIREKLEELGIPVLMDCASYETDPLARLEWIKVYGALFGKEDQAQALFDDQVRRVNEIDKEDKTDLTVAFFSINSRGLAVVRKSTDYVVDMIEMAGGSYIFKDLTDDNALSTVNMSMEEFYDTAVDADIIIYNSAIENELSSIDDLVALNQVFKDFKAVKEGNVWCTGKNMYQSSDAVADIVSDLHAIITDDSDAKKKLKYIHELK